MTLHYKNRSSGFNLIRLPHVVEMNDTIQTENIVVGVIAVVAKSLVIAL